MRIENAAADDAGAAVACTVAAFASDPTTAAFFDDSPLGRTAASTIFFGLLLEARMALGMPVLVARDGARVTGLAMGMDATGAEWPAAITRRWDDFAAGHPGLSDLFATYDAIVGAAGLTMPHRYLGVLSVDPSVRGTGVGAALLRAFLDLADADPDAEGTSLETSTLSNSDFYRHFGFEERASGALGAATLRVMYRPKPA